MKRGFTLLELLIVLTILSLLLTLFFPVIVKNGLSSDESFKTKISTLFSSSFVPGKSVQVCVDFKENSLTVGSETVKVPYKLDVLVLPGKVISSELTNKFCFDLKRLTYGALIGEEGELRPSILFTFPSGEVLFYNLSNAEAETLKDKVGKGRIVEWFSYYSF